MKTRFFPRTNEVNAWNVHTQSWTGRISAGLAFMNDSLMSSLDDAERLRISRLAAYRGMKSAATWWAANATSAADRANARKFC